MPKFASEAEREAWDLAQEAQLEKTITKGAINVGLQKLAVERAQEWEYEDTPPSCILEYPDDQESVEWLIDHYCPRTLFLLAGQEGIGKGLAAIWMTKEVLKNTTGAVLFMSTEDSGSEIHRRLNVAGVPKTHRKRVFHVEHRSSFKVLGEFVEAHDVVLIVADAIRDYMPPSGNRNANNNDDSTVRAGLVKWRSFAQEHNIAVAGIHHTNKAKFDNSGRRILTRERIGGAAAWQQVVRHVVFLDSRGHVPNMEHALGVIKSNHHPAPGFTMGYTVTPVGGLGVKFVPASTVYDDLDIYDWVCETDTVINHDELTADEEYDIVLQALKETQRDDGTLLGAGPLWHEALKDHGQIKKATIPAVLARIRADGLITGRTVKIEWTADVEARKELEGK